MLKVSVVEVKRWAVLRRMQVCGVVRDMRGVVASTVVVVSVPTTVVVSPASATTTSMPLITTSPSIWVVIMTICVMSICNTTIFVVSRCVVVCICGVHSKDHRWRSDGCTSSLEEVLFLQEVNN